MKQKKEYSVNEKSKAPVVFAGKAPGMDWVRPFADGFVGGKWLGYAQTHE